MCGEHKNYANGEKQATGSSPHVRGALEKATSEEMALGIIPACAGSTHSDSIRRTRTRDHPRMCGEHPLFGRRWRVKQGSSPHVRGAQQEHHGRRMVGGIIPACAGSTWRRLRGGTQGRDHPRMCGEHRFPCGCRTVSMGSSPHVRGAHCRCNTEGHCGGIIPACAGSTI